LAHNETGPPPDSNPADDLSAADKTSMPIRTLVILIAVALIVIAVRGLWRSSRPENRRGQQSARMVQCAQCGVYIPENEALSSSGRFYCSEAHLKDNTGKAG
jgi:uncharacterized protein